jgi:peptide chain release factor subunit 1
MIVERPVVSVRRIGETMTEIGKFETDLGKPDYGGFHGYEEHTASRRADEDTARMWKEASGLALESHQERPVHLVVVAGHKHDLDQFVALLHPYLHQAHVEKITVDPRTAGDADLLDRVRQLESGVRRSRDEIAIRSVLEGAHQGRPVARGTVSVLTAANLGAVEKLVVSGPFAKPGVQCPACGWLARSGEHCPTCEVPFESVDDVIGAAAERVLDHGGAFRQVGLASALDADGVAALLRFPLPA